MSTTTTALETDGLKTRLKETWMAGDYDRFSRYSIAHLGFAWESSVVRHLD